MTIEKTVNIILLGAPMVGKSAIRRRLCQNLFTEEYLHTGAGDNYEQGIVNLSRESAEPVELIELVEQKYIVNLFDISGDKTFGTHGRFSGIPQKYYTKNADAEVAFLVWDGTSENRTATLDELEKYLAHLKAHTAQKPFPAVIFICNKIDGENTPNITDAERQKIEGIDGSGGFVQQFEIAQHAIVETSAKIENGCNDLIREMLKLLDNHAAPRSDAHIQNKKPLFYNHAFFGNAAIKIAMGTASIGAGITLTVTAKPLASWLFWQLLATAAPQAAVIVLIAIGLALIGLGAFSVLRGIRQPQYSSPIN